jgi:hypothetical protein
LRSAIFVAAYSSFFELVKRLDDHATKLERLGLFWCGKLLASGGAHKALSPRACRLACA